MDDEKTRHPEMSHPYLEEKATGGPVIKVLSGVSGEKEYGLSKPEQIIGRDPASDIVIPDERVSRRHAVIIQKADEYLIQDLGSANGVYINNLKLEKAVLSNGDILQIGSWVLQFVWQR